METQEQTYLKGFNDGYKLARYQPEILKKIQDSLSEGVEYERGLIAGVQEWQQEKTKTRESELKELRDNNQELGPELSK
jgi:hypothetical protein